MKYERKPHYTKKHKIKIEPITANSATFLAPSMCHRLCLFQMLKKTLSPPRLKRKNTVNYGVSFDFALDLAERGGFEPPVQ